MVTNRGCKRLRDLEKSAGVLVIKKDDINYYPDGEHKFDIDTPIWASVYNSKSKQYWDTGIGNTLLCDKLSVLVNNPKIVFLDDDIVQLLEPHDGLIMCLHLCSMMTISEIRPASEYPQDYTGWALAKPTNEIDLNGDYFYITDPSALVYYINGQPAGETSPDPGIANPEPDPISC